MAFLKNLFLIFLSLSYGMHNALAMKNNENDFDFTNKLCRDTSTISTDYWDAEHYRKNSSIQSSGAELALGHANFKPDIEIVLDMGCGNGYVTANLVLPFTQAKQVIGLDPSENMLSSARHLYGKDSRLTFKNGRAEDIQEENLYDVITSFTALSWVPAEKKPLLFERMAKALKTGGKLVIWFPIHSDKLPIKKIMREVQEKEKWASYFRNIIDNDHLAQPEDIQSYLDKSHLTTTVFKVHNIESEFENEEAFYAWIKGWSQFRDVLGDEKDREYWLEVIQASLKFTNQQKNKPLKYSDYMLEVIAEK